MADQRVHQLFAQMASGQIDRRDFIKGATALGVSASALGLFLKAAPASAQEATAPVVATPCAGDACGWSGVELTVQCIDDSVKIPWENVREEFEAATGATLNLVLDPIGEAFPKLLNDAATGSNQFDAAMIGMWWLGELVGGEFVRSYDDFYEDTSGKFPQFDFEADLPGIQALHKYGDEKYVVPYDCDGQALYYRRDLLEDPEHQSAFESEYGYALAVPQTWEQLVDIAAYFTDKPLGGDQETGHGISMHLKVGGQGMFHFMSLSAPYVIGPENPKLYWFDPENMEPLVESQGHQRAMEAYLELTNYGPQAMISWALGEAWDYFLRGNAVFTYSWGDVAALAVERDSFVKGKIGTSQLPGTMAYVDPKSGEEYTVEEPNLVGNTTGGSWAGVVMAGSENADLAYYFLALTATEPKQRFYAAIGTDGVDPGKTFQILPPDGTGDVEDYVSQGWDPQDAADYTKAYYDTFQNPNQLPYLRIPGTFEYWTAMDIRLSEAVAEGKEPAQALAEMAEDFREINENLGVEQQLELYKRSVGFE
ncbi:MAG: extracellular solute-binding protein [Thermomicrobiales bacterium]